MRVRIAVLAASVMMAVLPPVVSAAPAPGSLVKLACPNGAAPDDPCKAVYFYGGDDHRHAFPNEKTYVTWYAGFLTVQTVSAGFLASLPLGPDVTPRPGVRMVKFQTDPKTYAVALGGTLRWVRSESAATALYGPAWNTKIDDVGDAFFIDYRFGSDIASSADFSPSAESAIAPTIDDDLPSTRRSVTVTTADGSFSVELVKLQRERFRMITAAAESVDCSDGCLVRPLSEYVAGRGADIGIHGTYFCPAEYPECAGKTNTFLWPFFDTFTRSMRNASSLEVHEGPMLVATTDGAFRYFHRTKDFGSSVAAFEGATGKTLDAAVANYPSLVEGGQIVVWGEPKLDENMKTVKTVRGAIGIDARFVYLAVVRSATVPESAGVMQALGATDAMNLDGGGSAAEWYGGSYAFGPGRDLPNAILFKMK